MSVAKESCLLQCLAVGQQDEREEEEKLVPWQGWVRKGRCPKAKLSWIQELGQKHPLAHTAVAVVVWEVVAVAAGRTVLVEQSAGAFVADIEDRVLGGQPELDPDCHADLLADGQQRRIEKPDLGQAVGGLFEGPDAQVLVNHQDCVGMDVHFAKAVVGAAIVPLVQPVLCVEGAAGLVVGFDLKIRSLNDHLGFGDLVEWMLAEASFVGYYYYFGLVTCTAEQ